MYRVAQEALRNVAAHSAARRVHVGLQRQDGRLQLVIADDGRGFDPDQGFRSGGLGLVSVDERVRSLGGCVTIESQPQGGTRMLVQIPLPDGSEAAAPTETVVDRLTSVPTE
jgi:signal transduction histidine kinase